jgi:uncharacterized membrane protein YqjE
MTSEHSPRFGDARDTQSATGSTGGLMHHAITEASRLVAGEIHLAKQEVGESLRAAVTAFVTGALAVFGLIAFLVRGIVAVVVAVPLHWVAALACAAAFLVIAVVAAAVAIVQIKRISPLRQTVQTLKEDVAWAKQQLTLDEK